MSREHLTKYGCDRCKKTIKEVDYEGETDGAPRPKVYVESKGLDHDEPIRFDDLCKPCRDRCAGLLAQIALDKPKDDSKNGEADTDPKPSETTASVSTDTKSKNKGKGDSK